MERLLTMGLEWWIIGGIVAVILLRANANAGAASGNPADQNVTKAAMAYVPFAHAGNAGTTQAGGVSNPKAVNGNGQSLVSDPTAAAINIAAGDAIIQADYEYSNAASMASAAVFTFTDPSTGIVSSEATYWRFVSGPNDDDGNPTGNWRAPVLYSGNPIMSNCPQPGMPGQSGALAWSGANTLVANAGGPLSW